MTPLADLRLAVAAAVTAMAEGEGPRGTLTLERPPRADFGDYSTNAALLLAPMMSTPPRAVAERLGEELTRALGGRVARVEVAGPGFLNLFLSDAWFAGSLAGVLPEGESFGGGGAAAPERVDLEFVSANPTGPLTVAHGRHAAFGDALGRILRFHGHEVSREFYVNDHGSQVIRLAESIRAHARGEPVPEDGYKGDYVAGLVDLERARTLDLDALASEGVEACLRMIRASLERFGVSFDAWFSEGALHEGHPSAVDRAMDELERRGEVYTHEGALWLRTTLHGDDKDRVLRRSNGGYTYFASDVAYHQDKLSRGFERLIDVWGADHHGYLAGRQAAFGALGGTPGALELIILQFVHLIEGGGRASMSKRRGEYVTLDELMDEIGTDAARYFLLTRSHDTTVELDLDLARRQSADNPVYYIQYAHARLVSVLEKAGPTRVAEALAYLAGSQGAAPANGAAWPLEEPDQEGACLARGGRRSGRAARAPSRRHLRPGARTGVHRLLPRLPHRGRGALRRGVLPPRPLGGRPAHDRERARTAGGQRAAGDVSQ
jgi:arginyl-tRNA synthetase